MNYDELKNDMRLYLGDVVDSKIFEHLFVDDYNTEYKCSAYSTSIGFTHLHKCVMLTNIYPKLNDYLEYYLKKYKNINETNDCKWSALHLAARNSYSCSSERTIEILIEAGIDINLQNNYGNTALHMAANNYNHCSTKRTCEILLNNKADLFNIKNKSNRTPIFYFTDKLKLHCQIDEETQTIGINTGRLTKCAVTR